MCTTIEHLIITSYIHQIVNNELYSRSDDILLVSIVQWVEPKRFVQATVTTKLLHFGVEGYNISSRGLHQLKAHTICIYCMIFVGIGYHVCDTKWIQKTFDESVPIRKSTPP